MTNEELTAIYNEANGLDPKSHYPITTDRIFAAMRAMIAVSDTHAEKWRAFIQEARHAVYVDSSPITVAMADALRDIALSTDQDINHKPPIHNP